MTRPVSWPDDWSMSSWTTNGDDSDDETSLRRQVRAATAAKGSGVAGGYFGDEIAKVAWHVVGIEHSLPRFQEDTTVRGLEQPTGVTPSSLFPEPEE